MSLGSDIKQYRKEAKLTQQELADKIGVSKSFISKIEIDNKAPSLEVKLKLAKVLNINPTKLMDPEDYFAGPGLTPEEISDFDQQIDTNKLAEDVKKADYLSKATTKELIEELNKRNDFPIELKIK